jgi:hypothetical protein
MPAVKFFAGLDLDPIGLFLDGHFLENKFKLRLQKSYDMPMGPQTAAHLFPAIDDLS